MIFFRVFAFSAILFFIGMVLPIQAENISIIIPYDSSKEGCEISSECYIPNLVTITEGDNITWFNEDTAFHTVTSGFPETGTDNNFDSGMFSKDEKFSHKFLKSGNFEYFCLLHPWMQGTIVVQKSQSDNSSQNGGGCLIATATFGTELASQVQFLREIRDERLMSTSTGISFMQGFNQAYYFFSPTIADMERKNPLFQDMVRISITPMLFSLSIMTLAEQGNDAHVLGLGIIVIILNIGLYFVTPFFLGVTLTSKIKSKKNFSNKIKG